MMISRFTVFCGKLPSAVMCHVPVLIEKPGIRYIILLYRYSCLCGGKRKKSLANRCTILVDISIILLL